MVNFNYFRTLNPETADLARELLQASDAQRSAFSSFMHLWMAFNGWMECVTDENTDAQMITSLADHQRLVDKFAELMEFNPDFREKVLAFAAMWPVLNIRDVRRKLGRDAFTKYGREDLMTKARLEGIKHQPVDWSDDDVPTWSQVLQTIYAIRCNLFHGSKSHENVRDHGLVVASDEFLRMFIERSACFEWHD